MFLVNSVDRILRIFRTDSKATLHKLEELVERTQWKTCGFSNRGNYVIAGSAQDAQHRIFIYDLDSGLPKIIEGPKEGVLAVTWHPRRPIIASTSTHGVVYIWAVQRTENWSAFAPDFKELEENVEYIEKENEFDHVDEDQVVKQKTEGESVQVDITTVEEVHFYSSDEEPIDDELVVSRASVLYDHLRLHLCVALLDPHMLHGVVCLSGAVTFKRSRWKGSLPLRGEYLEAIVQRGSRHGVRGSMCYI